MTYTYAEQIGPDLRCPWCLHPLMQPSDGVALIGDQYGRDGWMPLATDGPAGNRLSPCDACTAPLWWIEVEVRR